MALTAPRKGTMDVIRNQLRRLMVTAVYFKADVVDRHHFGNTGFPAIWSWLQTACVHGPRA